MDKIAKRLYDKYATMDYKKYERLMMWHFKFRYAIQFLPKLIKSTILCWRFPFLKFRTDKGKIFHKTCWYWLIDTHEEFEKNNGWRKAFGIQLCKELKDALKRHGMLRDYVITDIKEKWGHLEIKDAGAPSEVHDILLKYEYISERTCIKCGRRAKYLTKGYVLPFCEDCINDDDVYSVGKEEFYNKYTDWYGYTR